MTDDLSIPRDSVEYVTVTATADVDLDMAVEIAVTRSSSGDERVWLPAEWVGDVGTIRRARTTDPVAFTAADYPHDLYRVDLRLTDNPEVPIIKAGQIAITN